MPASAKKAGKSVQGSGLNAGAVRKKRQIKGSFSDQKTKWLEIVPYGIIGGMIPEASAILFRRKEEEGQKEKGQFMVWLSDLQSRMAVEQNMSRERPFGFAQKILKESGNLPERCFFIKTEEGRDIVALTFQGALKPIQFYADEVISFCMLNKCRFFCAKDFLKESYREIPKRLKPKLSEERPLYLN